MVLSFILIHESPCMILSVIYIVYEAIVFQCVHSKSSEFRFYVELPCVSSARTMLLLFFLFCYP